MSDAILFAVAFLGFFVLRAIAATIIFFFILPAGDRCPMCDAHTFRIQSRGWNLLMPWFRTSWCSDCGWEGLLRHGHEAHRMSRESASPPPGDVPGHKL
jgi:hypothetical protein